MHLYTHIPDEVPRDPTHVVFPPTPRARDFLLPVLVVVFLLLTGGRAGGCDDGKAVDTQSDTLLAFITPYKNRFG